MKPFNNRFEILLTIAFVADWPGIKPKAPGQRLPVPAGWRFATRALSSEQRCTRHHKAPQSSDAAPSDGQTLARLAKRLCLKFEQGS